MKSQVLFGVPCWPWALFLLINCLTCSCTIAVTAASAAILTVSGAFHSNKLTYRWLFTVISIWLWINLFFKNEAISFSLFMNLLSYKTNWETKKILRSHSEEGLIMHRGLSNCLAPPSFIRHIKTHQLYLFQGSTRKWASYFT